MVVIKPFPPLIILLLALCCLEAAPAAAQDRTARPTPSPAPAQESSQNVSPESADLAITATVTARELRFDVVPNPTVKFTGQPKRDTEWDAQRQNLPRPVRPGVTYRDVGVRLVITSVFSDIDRIVAEALGEIPMSDDAPTESMAAEKNDTQSTAAAPAGGNAAPATNATPARRIKRPRRAGGR